MNTGAEDIKVPFLADNAIFSVEDAKESKTKLLELICVFSKVAECKINTKYKG